MTKTIANKTKTYIHLTRTNRAINRTFHQIIRLLGSKFVGEFQNISPNISPVTYVLWAIHVRVKIATTSKEKKTPYFSKLHLTVFLHGLSFHTESMCTYCHHLKCLWWSLHRGIPSHRKEEKKTEPRSYHCQQTLLFPPDYPPPPPSHPHNSPTSPVPSPLLPHLYKILSYPLPVWEHNGR